MRSNVWKEFMRLFTTKVSVPLNVSLFPRDHVERRVSKVPPFPLPALPVTENNVWHVPVYQDIFAHVQIHFSMWQRVSRRWFMTALIDVRLYRSSRSKIKLMRAPTSRFHVSVLHSLSIIREIHLPIYVTHDFTRSGSRKPLYSHETN